MKLQIPEEKITYLLAGGENVGATLDLSVLQRHPDPGERSRWDRIWNYVTENNAGGTRALFFLDATAHMPMTFVQALLAMNYLPIPPSSEGAERVMDVSIQHTLDAIAARGEGNIVLVPRDGDFGLQLQTLLRNRHRVAVIGFSEFLGDELRSPEEQGLEIIDLEREIHAFNAPLPRIQVINLDDYNPAAFI